MTVRIPRALLSTALACLCVGAPTSGALGQPAERPQSRPTPSADWTRSLVSIADVRADRDGDMIPDALDEEVLVGGRVSAGTGVIRSDVTEVYVEDGTGGLRLRLPPDAEPVFTGDSVLVHGRVWFRDGMAEMVAPNVRTVSGEGREAQTLSLPLVDKGDGRRGPDLEGHEGMMVEIEGRVLEIESGQGGTSLVLLSGTDLVSVFSYGLRPAPLSFDNVEIGDYARVRGIAGQFDPQPPFNGSYVVFPLVEDDVQKAGLSPAEFQRIAWGVGGLLLVALLWAALLRRQVRKRSEALKASEVRYGHLFDAAADPVVVIDIEQGGEIVEANRAAQRAFGVNLYGDRPDGRPMRLSELAADEHEARLHLAEADRGGAAAGVLELFRPDGTAVPYEIATRRLRDRDGRTVVAIARDVEERRAYEHGLLTAIQAAEEAREQAEEAARLKSSILANMSHEIRTPLTAILGFADILREEVPDDLFDYADTIRTGGQRLLDTLNDLLDYARLDAERATLVAETIDVPVTVREAVALLAPLAQKKGIGLHLQSEVGSIRAVHSPSALGRIVTNLTGNAIKFTERGEVRVSVHGGDGFFAVRVQDTGVGMSESFLPDLYEAFKQESDGHGRDFEGTGLGLAITKRLVDAMGGEIRVWSQKGEGTLFEVALPLEAPATDPEAPPAIPDVPAPPHADSLADLLGSGDGDGFDDSAHLGGFPEAGGAGTNAAAPSASGDGAVFAPPSDLSSSGVA